MKMVLKILAFCMKKRCKFSFKLQMQKFLRYRVHFNLFLIHFSFQDLSDFSFEVQKLMDIHKSIFYVEDICLEIQEEHRSDLFEDVSSVKGQIYSDLRTFPLLEVDDTSLGINRYISEDKHIIFESNELQRHFNDLIVTHELILRDDSFKSLPVPIISDHAKIFSVKTIVEEILLKLKLQPSSTSDDIYLDWHLLEEDISRHNICTSLKMFEDIETYCINADVNSCESQMLILEFVLSDACSNEQKTEEKTEVLNIERCGNLKEPMCHDEIASSEICKKMTSGEALVDNKIGDFHSTSILNGSRKNSEGSLHSRSVEETTYEVAKLPLAMESNIINTNMTSFPDAIIIVNTQNVETEMIFEGDVGFLGGIMESSDELYAAAASLGIDFQLFCSYSSDITDEIILNFGTLTELFEMSHQQRVCALQKYLVPQASITLFSALSRRGEREDSRSGMTDCCSSASSGHESGNCCRKSDHEQKKRKYIGSPDIKAMPMDDLFQFEKNNDVTQGPLETLNSHNFWNLEAEVSDDIEKSIYFSKNQGSDAHRMPNCPNLTETSFGQNKKVHTPIVDKLGTHANKGEMIDIDDDAMVGEDFSFLHPKGLSSDWFSPSFPTAAKINSDLDSWIPTKENGQSSREGFILNSHTSLMNNIMPFEEKDPCYRRTPLSKAIFSDQPQKGSPWTIDFLNRIKEKSRMRHQSLPNILPAPCFGYSENSSKFRKRKSASILDMYRYKNSSTVPSMEHKGQKGPIQPPNSSKAVKTAPSSLHTWTPVDKRAKRVCYPSNYRRLVGRVG
ncbi:hypothetical protein L1987_43081 [Smallanthus sonchifolius]|uniref:Uncharacterized protein n=1 Tax=Smallanthus sonchifolius TaxID=185202 RepID=A0ACB9GKK7_9ASTR|nr:hypothetical protein L1987_43081 [Smallanthus sonchifolius]